MSFLALEFNFTALNICPLQTVFQQTACLYIYIYIYIYIYMLVVKYDVLDCCYKKHMSNIVT